jgi:molybdenum cofactor cytidylyltransferase
MAGHTRLCGVILSAGASSRMGREKALLPWPPAARISTENSGQMLPTGQTLLTTSISALKPFAESVIVVAGNNFESLAPMVAAHGALIVRNPAPERGQFSSLQVGLHKLIACGYDAAMITLVDCPPVSLNSMQTLHAKFELALLRGMWGVAPESGGRRGHPLFAGRALIDAFLAAPVTGNARAVKHQHAELIESIPVPDILGMDLNTPEQYAALASREDKQP